MIRTVVRKLYGRARGQGGADPVRRLHEPRERRRASGSGRYRRRTDRHGVARTGIVRLHYRRGETGQYVKRIKSAVERFLRLEVTMKIPTTLIIMDGYGLGRRPTATRSRGVVAGARQALPDLPEHGSAGVRRGCRTAGRTDRQQRGRPHEYRRGTRRLSDLTGYRATSNRRFYENRRSPPRWTRSVRTAGRCTSSA